MIYQHSTSHSNGYKSDAKTFLELTIHLLELKTFNPIVFCHDNCCFDKEKYHRLMLDFFKLLSFLDECGLIIETTIVELSDVEKYIYSLIMNDIDYVGNIKVYVLNEYDYSFLNISNNTAQEGYTEDDFYLVKIYLYLKTGVAINRKIVERIVGHSLSDAQMRTVRKQLETISCHSVVKRKDNSYEMR